MAKKSKKKLREEYILSHSIAASLLLIVLFFAEARLGMIGVFLDNLFTYIFGGTYPFLLSINFVLMIYLVFNYKKYIITSKEFTGILIFCIAVILTGSLIFITEDAVDITSTFFKEFPDLLGDELTNQTGMIGVLLYSLSTLMFARVGTIVVVCLLFVVGVLLLVPTKVILDLISVEIKPTKKQPVKQVKKVSTPVVKPVNKKKKIFIDTSETEKKVSKVEKTVPKPVKNVQEKPKTKQKKSHFIDVPTEITLNDVKRKKVVISGDEIAQSNSIKEFAKEKVFPNLVKTKNKPELEPTKYEYIPLDVFDKVEDDKVSSINKTSAEVKGQKVIEILNNFGIESELIKTHIGPSVTKFEIKPDSSVKVNRIQNISDNIKMELAARDIRIEAPIPGRNAVGIEIPNVECQPVRMYDLITSTSNEKQSPLTFFVGKDLMGKSVTCDIAKMPHLLIAGATGSGKSVCINAIISSILYRTNPDDVKLVLVDPKKVEFTPYHDVPHLLWPVITDAQMASNMLKKVVVMMEGRFDIFAEAGVRNIKTYNEYVKSYNASLNPNDEEAKPMKEMPFIVVIIDELADLMMIAGKDVEASIQRITQLARASGIHLIVATQRPSTDVITGIIKSNIPSRISFSVASSIDSRTILDQAGAERLLGNGDMLYFPQGETSPIRVQGVYVTDREVKNVTDATKKNGKPDYDDSYFEFLNINNNSSSNTRSEKDSLYDEVKEYVIDVQKASTSLLQRRFGIGYNRAAGLIEALEENGIVGPQNGSKPREVYIKKESE